MPPYEAVYPLTAGVSSKVLTKAIRASLERTPEFAEWQDEAWLTRKQWPTVPDSLQAVHRPECAADLEPANPARSRLAYDELLANQLALALVRRRMKRASGRALAGDGDLSSQILAALPYSLTSSQQTSIAEIHTDMAKPERMMRLLQGDVGSGKTIVALLALIKAVEAGAQGALMVPTDLLARQHAETLQPMAGDIQILVGTHALFQSGVEFNDLGLVVIDEQHRFGVHQRLALQSKAGDATDLLVMTATPIPRTLSLTLYGDMDVSRLTEKPAGRQPVDTRVLPQQRLTDVIDGIERATATGERAYWVCPLVEDSEVVDLAAAEDRYAALNGRFPGQIGLVHGRMKGPEKDAVMERFKSGEISVLVSTTVIEVGMDVPEATIMIIENAERFGLAQLHQLRGRVGRGSGKSRCLLLYQEPLGETARARLKIMRDTEDGFVIAEEDLRLRGSGELLGTRQSGVPTFRLANLVEHAELLAAARDDVELILARDEHLASPRGRALRDLLYLFERDEAVRLLSSG
jgi:ATP-dependent DNA helicase RecG